MAVLVVGMDIPQDCVHCKLKRLCEYGEYEYEDTGYVCPFLGRIDDEQLNVPRGERPGDCPLFEVKNRYDPDDRLLEEAGFEL